MLESNLKIENESEKSDSLAMENLKLKHELKKKEIIFSAQKEKLKSQLEMMEKHFEIMKKRQDKLLITQRKQILEIDKSEFSYSKMKKSEFGNSESKILIENEINDSDFQINGKNDLEENSVFGFNNNNNYIEKRSEYYSRNHNEEFEKNAKNEDNNNYYFAGDSRGFGNSSNFKFEDESIFLQKSLNSGVNLNSRDIQSFKKRGNKSEVNLGFKSKF